MSQRTLVPSLLLPLLIGGAWASAATITYVGRDTTTDADWRTTTTLKPFDADLGGADNVYGTAGYDLFATGGPGGFANNSNLNLATRLTSMPTGLSVSAVGSGIITWANGNDLDIDNPTLPVGPSVADIESGRLYQDTAATGTFGDMLNITATQDISDTLRIGLIYNGAGQTDNFRITQTTGGSSSDQSSFPSTTPLPVICASPIFGRRTW